MSVELFRIARRITYGFLLFVTANESTRVDVVGVSYSGTATLLRSSEDPLLFSLL